MHYPQCAFIQNENRIPERASSKAITMGIDTEDIYLYSHIMYTLYTYMDIDVCIDDMYRYTEVRPN